jgi:hypothetical protein
MAVCFNLYSFMYRVSAGRVTCLVFWPACWRHGGLKQFGKARITGYHSLESKGEEKPHIFIESDDLTTSPAFAISMFNL